MSNMFIKEHFIFSHNTQANIYVISAGNTQKPSVLFLHGFPDSSQVWLDHIKLLVNKYHVLAFDLPGAGKSDIPKYRKAYHTDNIIKDVDLVISTFCKNKKVHIIGHDWGSVIGWYFVGHESYSKKVLSFTSISGPHLDIMLCNGLKNVFSGNYKKTLCSLSQFVASWYVYYFILPVLPRLGIYMLGSLFYRLLLRISGVPADHILYKLNRKQVLKNSMNTIYLYKKNVLRLRKDPPAGFISTRTQIIIPTRDLFIQPCQFEYYHKYVTNLLLRSIDAGHWVQLSHPKELNKMITQFIDSK